MRQTIFVASVCTLALVFVFMQRIQPGDPVVFETEHLPELLPHPHEQEDSFSDPGHHKTLESPVFIAPRDLYVSDIRFEIVNAPSATLHHASLIDLSRPNATCSNMQGWKEIFVYGSDRMYDNQLTFPENHAVIIPKGTPLKLTFMIHNPKPPRGPGGIYHDVYSRVVFSERPGWKFATKELHPFLLHLDDTDITCGHKEADLSDFYTFTIPANTQRFEYTARGAEDQAASISFPRDATIVHLAGHLHGWQEGKELYINKDGTRMHTFISRPSSTAPYLYEIRYTSDRFTVKAGERLNIGAIYENPYPNDARGAMGIVGFYATFD